MAVKITSLDADDRCRELELSSRLGKVAVEWLMDLWERRPDLRPAIAAGFFVLAASVAWTLDHQT